MSNFIEQLESRRLFSVAYPASGTFNGTETPSNHASEQAIIAASGTKNGAGKVDATLDMTIASNSVITGTLSLTGVGNYVISGMSVGVDVSIALDQNGMSVGTFAGMLKTGNKKLLGPLTDTVDGKTINAKLNLINSASVKTKTSSGKGNNNLALAPGYYPNETPPPITSGLGAGTSPGNSTGLTGGNNSGSGIIDSGGGSLLG